METELARTMALVSCRLASYKDEVDLTRHPDDDMFKGDLDFYIQVGHSAIAGIATAMVMAGTTHLGSILDLPCGYGRVLRMLAKAFPEAELTACDVLTDGVSFCAERFGATGVVSQADPRDIPITETFDLVWCGSLLTHLPLKRARAFLNWMIERLSPEGLLVFSTHGRDAVHRWRAMDNRRINGVIADFEATGFGYRGHPRSSGYGSGYGTAACTPAWLAGELQNHPDICLLYHAERGFDDFQDLVAVVKRDPHHGQNAFINL